MLYNLDASSIKPRKSRGAVEAKYLERKSYFLVAGLS